MIGVRTKTIDVRNNDRPLITIELRLMKDVRTNPINVHIDRKLIDVGKSGIRLMKDVRMNSICMHRNKTLPKRGLKSRLMHWLKRVIRSIRVFETQPLP
jgi:hypothetical protein